MGVGHDGALGNASVPLSRIGGRYQFRCVPSLKEKGHGVDPRTDGFNSQYCVHARSQQFGFSLSGVFALAMSCGNRHSSTDLV